MVENDDEEEESNEEKIIMHKLACLCWIRDDGMYGLKLYLQLANGFMIDFLKESLAWGDNWIGFEFVKKLFLYRTLAVYDLRIYVLFQNKFST